MQQLIRVPNHLYNLGVFVPLPLPAPGSAPGLYKGAFLHVSKKQGSVSNQFSTLLFLQTLPLL